MGLQKHKLIRAIVNRIKDGYEPEKIILFGSYAKGTAAPDSDIDLLIIKDTEARRIDRWMEVKKVLRGVAPRVPISPLVYTPDELEDYIATNDFFLKGVIEEGEVLYG